MERRPTRIHPSVEATEGRVVTFRDGPRLVPDHLVSFIKADSYPDLTYEEWVAKAANKGIEDRVIGQALGLVRAAHFANR